MALRRPRLLNNPGTNGSLVVSKRKQGMRRYCLFLCGFALVGAASISAQQKIPPKQVLPREFRDWQQTGCYTKGSDPNAKAEAFWLDKETGIRNNRSCDYSAAGKTVHIVLMQYADPSSAFEAFTSFLRPGSMPTNLGQVAAFDKDGVLIQDGTFVIATTANISKDDLAALVDALDPQSEKSPLPPIRTYLPAEGRLVGSERYALGPDALKAALAEANQPEMPALVDAIGFGKAADAEAMLARYSNQVKGSGVLLLLEYPTPNVAEQHIHHLAEVLPTQANQGEESILRKGSLLSIVLSASSPEYAKSLREASDYETQVTWNEPSQTLTDPPLMSTMVKIFIGTGVFMVAAIVLGIAFGGVRIITKRLFPGKVFDRPAQIEVLQLGLSSKPIDPSDLY